MMRTGKSTHGKAWTSDEVLVLVTAWMHALAEILPVGHTTDQFNARVYDLYVEALCELRAELSGCAKETNEVFLERTVTVSGPEGGLAVMGAEFRPRSERPIKSKMGSLRQMFALISDHNSGRLVGSTGKPAWFDLEPEERTCRSSCEWTLGSSGSVEVGAVETEASVTPVPPDTTPKSMKRTRDAVDIMEEVMDKAVKAVREASRREIEEYIKHQEKENDKTRALLRELFGGY
ncbi:hypothetical protein PF011_g19071 [Phytophthora fragariae]|uniref:Uncharacterized protein n=1 Tax=Phytophthora fragariae TaxID=53985 RepID=A0A6A3J346_9STRA|nr:hypothetical protein PF011_g19071 [Phytophthora fragariae]